MTLRAIARRLLEDRSLPPVLAIACGRALILDDYSELEALCREAWGDEGLARVLAA